jgi:integrase
MAELREATVRLTLPADDPQHIQHAAKELHSAVAAGRLDADDAERAMDATMDNHVERLHAKHGTDGEGDPKVTADHFQALRDASRTFRGEAVGRLSRQVDLYMTEVGKHVRAQTIEDKRRVYGAFRKWLVADRDVRSITRAECGKYLSEKLMPAGRAPKTVRSELAQLSALWRWMLARGVVDANVWSLMSGTVTSSTRGGVQVVRRPWTEAELLRLFKETDQADPMWSVAALSLYGGLRVEEVCQLKVTDIHGGAIHVNVTKSAAGVRAVPVHPVLQKLVQQLVRTSTDTYLIPGLLIAGRDAKRSVYLSKRFAWHLRKVMKVTDKSLVLHGLRHTFTHACELAEIPVSTTQLLVGHSRRGSITYGEKGGSYSHGLPLEQLAKKVASLSFGKVDKAIRSTVGKLKVTHRSARRPRARLPRGT